MSDITLISAEKYLASPCSSLPLPYAVCGGRRLGAVHMGGEGGAPGAIPPEAFSRMLYRLGDMKRFETKRFSARQLFLAEDADDAALIASLSKACRKGLDIPSFIGRPYYNEKLCVAVHDRSTGECVCAGLGGLDSVLHEAWFERLLIPEGHAGGEASLLLINELLRRMAPMADFVTANAPAGSGLERLLRKCGFGGGDIWVFNGNSAAPRI